MVAVCAIACHRDAYRLAGKLGLVVSTDYKGTDEVAPFIHNMMTCNKMAVIDTVFLRGYSQCYACGFGHDCASGNVLKDHEFLEAILPGIYLQIFVINRYRLHKLIKQDAWGAQSWLLEIEFFLTNE